MLQDSRLGGGRAPDIFEGSPRAVTSLKVRNNPLAPADEQRRVLADLAVAGAANDQADFAADLVAHAVDFDRLPLEYFQINLGKLCNMSCRHCHVDAGPDRTDAMMNRATVDACLAALDKTSAHTVDITGGAPELNPNFRYLVAQAVARGKQVIDRCNLTVLLLPKYADLPKWLAERGVELVCSLPHYRQRNTDAQRGAGTYARSIEALRRLNAVGYGKGDPQRRLTLMANPAGAFLAGDQAQLERDWRAGLLREHGLTFDRLIALNNMPISRYLEWLLQSGNLEAYMRRLVSAFNPAAAAGVMCRNTLSVGWDGGLYDCDFNQMLEIRLDGQIADFDPAAFISQRILTDRHCYGCTAGAGSSCGGATA
ncbi:MAG: arsenosugar biosynthesis radical SAM protein ArsS [Deltaproteobacteria bacterium]|nr:arsenosugar biosynthesis radical SAM protein ArsS [Deltaproteobacteria bacterium]